MIGKNTAKTISNLMFLAPIFVALLRGYFFHSFLILLVFASSTAYHNANMKKYFLLDVICALTLISYNIYSLMNRGVSIYIWLTILFIVSIAFYYKYIKAGDNYQWHILSALITLIVVSV